MDAQRALLDKLMGTSCKLTEEEKKAHHEVRWDDPNVCSPFMAHFCPHDLFVNTNNNLGPCPEIHDLKLKDSSENSPRHDTCLRRKIRHGRDRLAQDADVPPPVPADKSKQLPVLEEKIKKLLEQIEQLGETGKVDEAEALIRKVDLLNAEKTALTNQADNKAAMLPQEKKMELCETCGSFLVANDVLERTQSHVTGKQHIGYGMVRDFLVEYKVRNWCNQLAGVMMW